MIPGVSETCAATILAEIGPDVRAFQSDAHLASWAGLCPGSYESADKIGRASCRERVCQYV